MAARVAPWPRTAPGWRLLLWRLRCALGGGCLVGAVWRRGGDAAVARLLDELDGEGE